MSVGRMKRCLDSALASEAAEDAPDPCASTSSTPMRDGLRRGDAEPQDLAMSQSLRHPWAKGVTKSYQVQEFATGNSV